MKVRLLSLICSLVLAQQQNLGWVFVVDDGGADDEVAQADVNYMGFNKDSAEYAEVTWSWDDTFYPGANSGDGCSLWDLNKNGNADFALCVRINTDASTNQVSHTLTQLFDCRDTRQTTCPYDSQPGYTDASNHSNMFPTVGGTGPKLKSNCWINFMKDPFANVSSHLIGQQNSTHDTRAFCRLYYDELREGEYPNGVTQPGDPQLINVCSYPSSSPTSNQKDCVVTAGSGFLIINKWTSQARTCSTYQGTGLQCGGEDLSARCTLYNCTDAPKVLWNFTYTSTKATKTTSVFGWGWTPLVTLPSSTYSVSEGTLPTGWTQIGFRCADNQTNPKAVVISPGQTLACYFINYFGTLAEFTANYGSVSNGNFGNITLDEYVPPRTFAPTPVTPTPACPPSLNAFFTACKDSDFGTGSACSATCTQNANTLQKELAASTVAVQDECIGSYNTQHGPFLTTETMNTLSIRVTTDPQPPLCSNGAGAQTAGTARQGAEIFGVLLLSLLLAYQL